MSDTIENEEHWDRILWLCDATDAKAHISFGHIRNEVLAKDKELAELREGVEKSEKKRDHWESLWKKSSMSVIGLRERAEKADKELEDYHRECKVLKVNNDSLKYRLSSAEMERDELVVLVPKLKGFLSVERNKVEGWVEKCAEKDKRIGSMAQELLLARRVVEAVKREDGDCFIDVEAMNKAKEAYDQGTQPKPTTPSVPSEGECHLCEPGEDCRGH